MREQYPDYPQRCAAWNRRLEEAWTALMKLDRPLASAERREWSQPLAEAAIVWREVKARAIAQGRVD